MRKRQTDPMSAASARQRREGASQGRYRRMLPDGKILLIKTTARRCRALGRKAASPLLTPARSAMDTLHLGAMGLLFLLRNGDRRFAEFLWGREVDLTDHQVHAYLSRHSALSTLGEDVLFRLHRQCNSAGFLESAQHIKETVARKSSGRAMAHAGDAELLEISKACIYRGDYKKAVLGTELLIERAAASETRWRANEIRAFALLLDGDIDSAQKIWDAQAPDESNAESYFNFKHYCRDRTVAIVGPADPLADRSVEIDRHDIVVRMNHFISKPMSRIGTKTNIVYYNGQVMREHRDEIQKELSNYDFVVLRRGTSGELSRRDQRLLELPTYDILFKAVIMGIQRVFIDIIRHRPKAIKIYNLDFYTRRKAYSANYIGASRRQKLARSSLQSHDLVQNFLMIQKIYDNGFLKADTAVSEILSFSKDDYISRLSLLYGAPPASPPPPVAPRPD
jgi:hypothetical protein